MIERDPVELGLVTLQPGDVVKIEGGELFMIDYVNGSRSRCVGLNRQARKVTTRFDGTKTFLEPAKSVNIARDVDPSVLVERRGKKGLQEFLAGRKTPRPGNSNQPTGVEGEGSMKKEKTTEANGMTTKGALGSLMDHSVVSVIRRLGKEGVSTAHVRAIMKAQGIKVADATVSIQTNAGRNKKGDPADLTEAQVKELIKSAPEPVAEPKPEKKAKTPKGKAPAKAKTEKKAVAAAELPRDNSKAYTS